MSAINTVIGARTAFTITLNLLSNGTYVAANALDLHAFFTSPNRAPLDVIIELEVTPGTVSGNKQALAFAQISMDGTNYSTGPTSGTTRTDELNLYSLGEALPLNSSSTLQRKAWSLRRSNIGFVPWAIKPVIFNDSGAPFGSSGCALYYTVISGDAT